jgi:cytosine/adenosine deaminase-related metal-dependent hydrolase
MAARDCLPVAMHVAESRDELELLDAGSGPFRDLLEERSMWDDQAVSRGTRPLAYLHELAAAPRSLVIHGAHLAMDELDFIAARREQMTLVYCPRTHAYFNRDRYPLAAALDAGVRVVLGTDSRASSPDLSVLAEVRHAARAHPQVGSSQLLQMATQGAAEALGIAEDVGSITPGKWADLTAVPIDTGKYESPTDAIVFGNGEPIATWYRGTPSMGSADERPMTNDQ